MKIKERILYQFIVGIFFGAAIAQADLTGLVLMFAGVIFGYGWFKSR